MSDPEDRSVSGSPSIPRGGCPVKHDARGSSSTWTSWFKRDNSTNANAVTPSSSSSSMESSGCPVVGSNQRSNPASIEEASKHSQTPQPNQKIPLSVHRAVSSIPKPHESDSGENQQAAPAHQPAQASKWVYPSEQQFFNAMKRKGWELPEGTELTIPHVVQIHNAVNERGWSEVLKWENMRDNPSPRLVKFIGRPKDLSPRARFYSMLWMRNEPFDRHDWYVDRGDNTGERRYVIDFYNGEASTVTNSDGKNPNMALPSMYLDVRPALDDLDSVQDRMKMFMRDAFPGIFGFMGTQKQNGANLTNMRSGTESSRSSSQTQSNGER